MKNPAAMSPLSRAVLAADAATDWLLARDRRLMGDLANGRIVNAVGWTVTALLILLSVVLVVASVSGMA